MDTPGTHLGRGRLARECVVRRSGAVKSDALPVPVIRGRADKEFYVCFADSRGALTPSNVHRTFSVRLNRFTSQVSQTELSTGNDAFDF
ncbi:MAG: hypothetical protein IJ581_00850 [Paludibacteraceae bacterium]|nr:hypothetical protein [Paludibacteraceae bacterium]